MDIERIGDMADDIAQMALMRKQDNLRLLERVSDHADNLGVSVMRS